MVRCLTSKQERPRIEDSSLITLYWSLLVEGRAGAKEKEAQAAAAFLGWMGLDSLLIGEYHSAEAWASG